jgi:hypothetical protein
VLRITYGLSWAASLARIRHEPLSITYTECRRADASYPERAEKSLISSYLVLCLKEKKNVVSILK